MVTCPDDAAWICETRVGLNANKIAKAKILPRGERINVIRLVLFPGGYAAC